MCCITYIFHAYLILYEHCINKHNTPTKNLVWDLLHCFLFVYNTISFVPFQLASKRLRTMQCLCNSALYIFLWCYRKKLLSIKYFHRFSSANISHSRLKHGLRRQYFWKSIVYTIMHYKLMNYASYFTITLHTGLSI